MNKRKKIVLCILFALTCTLSAQPLVKTTVAQGEIVGVEIDGCARYPAIPYAEAPVGQLRWKAPVTKKPWKGVYNSDQPIKRPWQPADPSQIGQDLQNSEDCLYLGISTPANSTEDKLPVLVLIHGGGFVTGVYSEGKKEVPHNFMDNNIVVVSIEYRMGVYGFLATPELSKESPNGVSGNYGILDQIEALKWIKQNIHAFGGDPDHITLWGGSAGSISCGILTASPLAKGLFQGVIAESGGFTWPLAEQFAQRNRARSLKMVEDMGVEYMAKHHCKNLKQLRQLPPDSINDCMPMGTFWPNVDGYVIPYDVYKMLSRKEYNDVNLLIGSCSDEGASYGFEMPVTMFKGFAKVVSGDKSEEFLKLYPAETEKDTKRGVELWMRDSWFGWWAYSWANLQSRTSSKNVYYYYFDHISHNTSIYSENGASHCADGPFAMALHLGPMNDVDEHMAQIMPHYWLNFIKTGNPNQDGIPYWPAYEEGSDNVMIFKTGFRVGSHPTKANLDFWERVFNAARK